MNRISRRLQFISARSLLVATVFIVNTLLMAPAQSPAIGSNTGKVSRVSPSATSSQFRAATVTTIQGVDPADGNQLSAQVSGSNGAASPTGTISFVDVSDNNRVVATADLGSPQIQTSWAIMPSLPAGAVPLTVASGDFTGDGKLDVVVATASDSGFRLFTGNGDGTFSAVQTVSTGHPIVSLISGDFDLDGIADIAYIGRDDARLHIMLGGRNSTFTESDALSAGRTPIALASGDFNGDGALDIAVVSQADSSVTIYLNSGGASFTASSSLLSTGTSPSAIAAADFNDDGKTDLAVVNFINSTVSVYLGKGGGNFSSAINTTVQVYPRNLVVQDFNGDGKADIAVSSYESPIALLWGQGDGSFTSETSSIFPTGPVWLAAGHFGMNAAPALGVVATRSATLTIYSAGGSHTFLATKTLAVGSAPVALQAADFSGNGADSLIIADPAQDAATIVLTDVSATSVATSSNINISIPGQHQVAAVFPGDSRFSASTSGTVVLQGTSNPGSFMLQAVGNSSQTVSVGASTDYSLSISPVFGWVGTITIACSGLPANATCFPNPNQLSVSSGSDVPFKVQVNTSISTAMHTDFTTNAGPPAIAACVLFASFFRRRGLKATFASTFGCGLLFAISFCVLGCGSGIRSVSTADSTTKQTSAGTYAITVTATSGTIQRTQQLQMIVK